MAGKSFKYFRLTALKTKRYSASTTNNATYLRINSFEMYEDIDKGGVDLARTYATIVANKAETTNVASNAVDGVDSTEWKTPDGTTTAILTLSFTDAITVRRFVIKSTSNNFDMPYDFYIEGSNDGNMWSFLYDHYENQLQVLDFTISFFVGGNSKLDTGESALKVLVYDWSSWRLLAAISPNQLGDWELGVKSTVASVLVTHIGPSGYQPRSDGPITPFSW